MHDLTDTTPLAIGEMSPPTATNPRKRILLVEDGVDCQILMLMLLEEAEADIVVAENGLIAVDLATTQPFDLILMDIEMPVMDGYTATSELRHAGVNIPIIALTANATEGDRDRCIVSGCSGYLSKPIDAETLLRSVNQNLGNRLPLSD